MPTPVAKFSKQASANAANIVAPRPVALLYGEAFDRYGPVCLWSTRRMEVPSIADVLDAAARLKREGNMASRRFAEAMKEAVSSSRDISELTVMTSTSSE